MRFRGGGVGHKSTREATDCFKNDRDKLDLRIDINDDEVLAEDLEPEPSEKEIGEDEEEDYGYTAISESPSDSEVDDTTPVDEDDPADEYFGPEDDGGAVDPDMNELGYAEL